MENSFRTLVIGGKQVSVTGTFMGAEGRFEDYVYLQMLQREWERPAIEFEGLSHLKDGEGPSARAALVLLFWGYFETRVERLLRISMHKLPPRVLEDALRRYSGIHARLYDLYKILFDTNYFADLEKHGYREIADLLKDIHGRRNEFTHGKPQAINDTIVTKLVENLQLEHEAWIAVYNNRIRN